MFLRFLERKRIAQLLKGKGGIDDRLDAGGFERSDEVRLLFPVADDDADQLDLFAHHGLGGNHPFGRGKSQWDVGERSKVF